MSEPKLLSDGELANIGIRAGGGYYYQSSTKAPILDTRALLSHIAALAAKLADAEAALTDQLCFAVEVEGVKVYMTPERYNEWLCEHLDSARKGWAETDPDAKLGRLVRALPINNALMRGLTVYDKEHWFIQQYDKYGCYGVDSYHDTPEAALLAAGTEAEGE